MKFFPAPCLLVILAVIPLKTLAADENDAELIRSMQRQQHIDAELLTDANVRFEQPLEKNNYVLSEDETPCTRVNYISLDDKTARKFSFLPSVLMKETAFKTGMCLGSNNLSRLQKAAQQILIVRGYLTSQAIIQPQNMDSGILKLRVSAGEIGDIRYEEKRDGKSAEGSISTFNNKFPLYRNKILNLRDVEQGLENLRRLSSVKTDIQIIPSEEEGKSDLQIKWQQNKPIRFSIGIDDAGGKTTGKYQGNVALSFDNPLGLSDLFYVSYGRGLVHKTDLTDATGTETESGSRSYSVHYSVPVKKWLFSFNHNGHRYHEATEGYSVNYDYNGKQYQSSLAAERMLWRNRLHKTSVGMKLWTRQTYKYIDDAEIEVQRRRSAGWEAELRHRAYLNRWQLDGKLSYKRGTGMRQSMPAPEENGGDILPGTSRMKIITAGLDAAAPFILGKQQFFYATAIQAQWNKTPLVAQDKLSIGSRYTVRGFDGEQSLFGERGFYWQNTLTWYFHPNHQFYLGADYGRVSGESAQYVSGKQLMGAVVGFRGGHKVGGMFAYDLFAGKPLHKPKGFQTTNTVYGFNLNYSF